MSAGGGSFEALVAAAANDRAPKRVTVGLTMRAPRVPDGSPCLTLTLILAPALTLAGLCLLPTDATARYISHDIT